MRFISFDLETTGFISGVDQIVEIGAIRYVDGQPDAVFATLVDPKMSIPEGASRVNGITNDMVAGKITIVEVEKLVQPGELDPNFIHVPGIFVQRIFQGVNYEKRIEQRTVRPLTPNP